MFLMSCDTAFWKGKTISFDKYKLYVQDWGKGEPTVIIEGGIDCSTSYYIVLQKQIAKYTRVISYDHAGIGRSTPSPNPRTLPYYIKELKELLKRMDLKPPYILVGHSLGGHIIRYYTYLYPNEVAGLVFIDCPHEDWTAYVQTHLSKEDYEKYDAFFNPKKSYYKGVGLIEIAEYEANCDSIRNKKLPSNIPVKMYTGTNYGPWAKSFGYHQEDMKVWAEMQHSIISGVNDAEHIIDKDASHAFHFDKPDLIINGIKDLISKYKKNRDK